MKVGFGIFILIFASLSASAAPIGYRVVTPNKTVIQIARDVYNDQRVWKEIARVNGLRPPYELHKGQVLVLPSTPAHSLPLENRVAAKEVPPMMKEAKLPSVKRELMKDKRGVWIYTVNERAPTLQMVALELYGDRDVYKELIKTNNLTKPYNLALGQKLKLSVKPLLSERDGDKLLIKTWARLTNEKMVARLEGDKHEEERREVASRPKESVTVETTAVETAESVITASVKHDEKKIEENKVEVKKVEEKKAEERKPFWSDFKLPDLFPKVVAPAAPVAQTPVYVVQMTSVPVGSICITPPQPFSNDPRWVIQPMPAGVQPTFVNPLAAAGISAQMLKTLTQVISGGEGRGVASQSPAPASAPTSATAVAAPAPPAAPSTNPFQTGETTTTDYWMGRDWKPPLKDGQ